MVRLEDSNDSRSSVMYMTVLAAAMTALPVVAVAQTFTYTYTGPNFTSTTDNLTINLTTPQTLSPSTVYTTLPIGAYGTIDVHAGSNSFSIPLQPNGFFVNTDASGNIASWFIVSDVNNLTQTTPMSGRDYQIYSMDTLSPAVPVPGGVTGRYSYDQGSIVSFFSSCTNVPGCTLAGNGQPYVYNFGANDIPVGGGVGTGLWVEGRWTMVANNGTPTCSAPLGKFTKGKGKVTAIGPHYFIVNRTTITYDDCTTLTLKNAIKVGSTVTYKAFGNVGTGEATELQSK